MEIVIWIFYILAGLTILQLVYPFILILLSRLFGRERVTQSPDAALKQYDFGSIITAYRNADIAKPLVMSLLKQNYTNHTVYLVADECPDFEWDFQHPQFVLLKPDPALRLKAKSIIHGIENFKRNHEFITIFDADNLAHPDFLKVINRYANSGHRCIQGQRTAKNLDTSMAAADSLGELYKNYLERYAPYLLGGSSVISGSGMATESALYKAYLESPEIEQGKHLWKKMLQEDKILQNFLLRRGEKIAWAKEAICYDEKVETGEAVETQRSRWLFSYFQNFPNSLGILRRGLLGFNFNQISFGFITMVLPMVIQLVAAVVLMVLGHWIAPMVSLAILGALVIFSLTVLWSLSLAGAPGAVWGALTAVPAFFYRQVRGLWKMGNPNKNFKHTEHKKFVSVEDVLKNE